MNVMFGNLTTKEMEAELGIELTEDIRDSLEKRRQDDAQEIAAGKLHIFHLPLIILCGDEQTATYVAGVLQPYSDSMMQALKVAW